MPMDLKNNPLTSFICTSQSVSKERKSILHTGEMLLSGVPQSSILGPLLFNIYVSAICFLKRQECWFFVGYADNSTPYTCSSNIEEVLENLQGALERLFQWFPANHLAANAGKCHVLPSSKITSNIAISNTTVRREQKVKLFGINLENGPNINWTQPRST